MIEIIEFEHGLTIRELKALIRDWPEIDDDGNSTEVWIETGPNLSSPVVQVFPLNKRSNAASILFCSNPDW